METMKVIGAGLAGCEAAWQLAQRGIPVELYEMKPQQDDPGPSQPATLPSWCAPIPCAVTSWKTPWAC